MEERERLWRRLLEEVKEEARRLAERLAEHGVRVEEILLFGSIARGDFKVDSDVDLVVVSPDWEGMSIPERMGMLYRLWSGKLDDTMIPLTPRELRERAKRSVVLRDASAYRIRIYP